MIISGLNNHIEIYKIQKTQADINKAARMEGKQDSLAISSKALDFQAALKAVKEVPDIRESLVNDVKSKIESGSYNVSAEEISDKILSGFDKKI